MSLYSYQKTQYSLKKKAVNYISYITLTVGALLLFWSFYPVISFEIYSQIFLKNKLVAPIASSETASSVVYANSVWGDTNNFSNNLRDFTQASLWFPTKTQSKPTEKVSVSEYYLSIPKLNINNALVKTQGEDLAKSLIHFLPTSVPGENGNVAIFGHSTLPQLYNVKDYKTIFTYLPSLNKGDKIIIQVNSTDYEYEVYEMFVVKPDQVSVLEQRYDGGYLTLVTCVPPGTYWNRLVVRAKLIDLPHNL